MVTPPLNDEGSWLAVGAISIGDSTSGFQGEPVSAVIGVVCGSNSWYLRLEPIISGDSSE